MSRTEWAVGPDGVARPAGPRSLRATCSLCGHKVAVRFAWQVPKGSGEFYCATHWSTDDRRLRHEFGEAEP